MVARTHHPASERPHDRAHETGETELAGWDPYIVALTASAESPSLADQGPATPDTRKGQLMAWLREHGADA